MKHTIEPAHHALIKRFEEVRPQNIPVTYYAGYDTDLYTDDNADMNSIVAIHFYDSYTGTDGLEFFQPLEDARQQLNKDHEFVRVVVLALPLENRTDIELQTTKIQ